jgi:DNA polymerase-3 subunit delta
MDHKLLLKDIKNKKFEKMYFLHGEEAYFIDLLSDAIMEHAMEEHERDFNQTILYGKDTELLALISELKAYPMMAERRLVVLKEAQDFRNMDGLEKYAEDPSDTTIFVICHKYKTFDARKKILKSVAKNGTVFKSDKVREYQLADWIQQYVKSTGYGINSKGSMLLAEFLGTDLGRIVKELEKLAILLPAGTTIDETHIELNIGISKDYNVFEFVNAISARNIEKAFKIILKDPNVKAILINIVGGLVRCDRVAQGVVDAYKNMGTIPVPIIVRLQGTNAEEAKKLIDDSGLNVHSAVLLQEAADKVKEVLA